MTQRSIVLVAMVGVITLLLLLTLEPWRAEQLDLPRRAQLKAGSPSLGPASSVTQDTNDIPEAEQLRPGQQLSVGEPFTTQSRLGQKVTGTIFAAQSKRASALVVMPHANESLASWSLLFNALRATRDYHFIIVDPPTEPWRWAQRLESIAAVGAFEAAVAICIDRLQAEGVVLMASAESASAAVVLAAQRRDVLAVALVDAKLIGPMSRWEPVLDAIKDRQSWWLFGQQGSEVLSEIRSRLALARVVVKPGGSAGIDLLNQAKRASSGLAGWLFAITPSVIEPLRQNDG